MMEFARIGDLAATTHLNTPKAISNNLTVAILGVPRGGTTMVAAVVNALGIDLGPTEELKKYHYEDQTINSPHLEQQTAYVNQRNRERDVWGWKNPVGLSVISGISSYLRNPHLIFVFRDLLSSVQGEMRFDEKYSISPRRTFEELAQITVDRWSQTLRFINHSTFPILLVSYERALLHREKFVSELAQFLSVDLSAKLGQKAVECINPNGGYITFKEQEDEH